MKLFAAAVLLLSACATNDLTHANVVDLTYAFDEHTLYWPNSPSGFELKRLAYGPTPVGYFYSANLYSAPEHGGTHIDAPIHFSEHGRTLDAIPPQQLIAPAVVLDITSKTAADPDYRLTADDVRDWERAHGRIEDGAIVLLRTGYSRFWPDAARYLGTAERGQDAVAKLHFPGLHQDAARWLAESRRIKAVGLDTASIDYGQSTLYESHRELYARDIPAFENLTNLDRVPAKGAFVVALPMKIKGGSGGPLRAIASVP